MVRLAGSKEKIVLAPTRVIVLSLATSSARDATPVRTRSGMVKMASTTAGLSELSAVEITLTSLTTCVNFDCFKSAAGLMEATKKLPRHKETANSFFMRSDNYWLWLDLISVLTQIHRVSRATCQIISAKLQRF